MFGFYGRSGQGVETAVRLFSKACFLSGLYVQSFTFIGQNRRGSHVSGFVKTDKSPILSKTIEDPDFYVLLEASGMDTKSFKEGSMLVINAPQKPLSEQLKKRKIKVYSVDATEIALSHLKTNMPNTVMLGALTKLFNKVSMKSIKSAMEAENLPKENGTALEEGYRNVK